jgi:Chromosome segregation ATPases
MVKYIGWRATEGPANTYGLIAEFQEALDDEIEALKREQNKLKIFVENGQFIIHRSGKFLYQFSVEIDRTIPEDIPCQVVIKAETLLNSFSESIDKTSLDETIDKTILELLLSETVDEITTIAHIVLVNSNKIVLAFNKNFGKFIPQAIIQIRPWVLLEQFKAKLEKVSEDKLEEFDEEKPLKLFGFIKPDFTKAITPQNFDETDLNLNPRQKEALLKALSQEITFIWGPPGTGKTRTIATIIKKFIEMNKKVLLTAHTNAAIDEALLKLVEILPNKELIEEGRIIRYGIPTRNDPALNQIAFDEILARKREPLEQEIEALEEEIKKIDQRRQLFKKLIESCDKLTQIMEEETFLQKEIEKAEKDIFELKKQLDDVRKNLSRPSSQIETPNQTLFSLPLFTGPNSEQTDSNFIDAEVYKKEQAILITKKDVEVYIEELKKRRTLLQKEAEELEEEIKELCEKVGVKDCEEARRKFRIFEVELTKLEQQLQQEIGYLRTRIDNLSYTILDNCLVVGATLSKVMLDSLLHKRNYAVMVLDEASMAPLPIVFFRRG